MTMFAGRPLIVGLVVSGVTSSCSLAPKAWPLNCAHASLEVIKTLACDGPVMAVVNVGPVGGAGVPLSFQAYVGALPPFVGFAVKVMGTPRQIGPEGLRVTVTEGRTLATTVT